jgi:Family of unknown function (DUF6064)
MPIPFSRDDFFAVFASYNDAVFPIPAVLMILALIGTLAALRRPSTLPLLLGGTGALWLWMAVVYCVAFFAKLSAVGYLFAAAFAVQGLAVFRYARSTRIRLTRPIGVVATSIGAILIAYSLIGYPLLGYFAGQRYPAVPTFGLPCPTTIFTVGVFVWCGPSLPWKFLIIPAAWAVIGTSAALNLSVAEDLALIPAVLVVIAVRIAWRHAARVSLSAQDRLAANPVIAHDLPR